MLFDESYVKIQSGKNVWNVWNVKAWIAADNSKCPKR